MENQEIINTGQQIATEQHIGGNTAARVGGVIEGIGVALNNKDAANGYYEARMSGGSIIVTAPNYVLGTGGNLRLKMPAAGTVASTLTIGNASQVPLLYNGAAVTPRNGWDAGEIIDVFYDGQNFLASNSEGGGDVKVEDNITGADLDITDDSDNTLVRFSDGHVKTKNFDSRDLKAFVGDEESTDLDFADEGGNIIMRVANGHVRTKRFNSSTALTESDLDTLYSTLRNLNHPLKGKKVAFLGDSITAGTGASSTSFRYSTVLSSMAGCTEVNLGVGGTCLAANTKNGLTAQRFITRATSANLSLCDVVFVFGGSNDFSYDIKPVGDYFSEQTITGNTYMGTTKRIPNPDNESFSGALHELITQIRTVTTAQIIYVQILNRGHWSATPTRPNSAESNANGDYMQDFRDAIDVICKSYCIPVVPLNSLFEQDWTNDTPSSLSSMDNDGIHPNNLGHRRIAEILYNWVFDNITI